MNTAFLGGCQFCPRVIAPLMFLIFAGCATTAPVTRPPSGVLYQKIAEDAHPIFKLAVETATAEAWAPLPATLDPEAESEAVYRLSMNFRVRERPLHDTEMIWTTTTLFLFTLYPSTCARYEVELMADLHDMAGRRLKSWHLRELDTAFLWLFQASDCNFQSDSTIRKIAESMLKDLYGRMEQDGVLSGLATTPIDQLPLVHVSAENAMPLVQRVTKTDAPFKNFTFEPEAGQSVARTLKIRFDFVKAEQSVGNIIGRGTAAIMTLGLIGLCKPNDMILNARILDANGTTLREYRFAQKTRAVETTDCTIATDQTRPDLAADLLRQLFRKIEEDKVI